MAWLKGIPGSAGYIDVSKNVRFTSGFQVTNATSLWGTTWYVDPVNGASGNSGRAPEDALYTIVAAVALADDYDTIILAPGEYGETETIAITQNYLKLLGSGTHQGLAYYTNLWYYPGTFDAITVEAHGVEIAGISIANIGAFTSITWGGASTAYNKGYLHDCHLVGGSTGTYGVYMNTADMGQLVIDRCDFTDYNTACIYSHGSYNTISNCNFEVIAAKDGIYYKTTTSASYRPWRKILDNKFFTADSTDANGIVFSDTPASGVCMIDGNRFQNFAGDTDCISTVNGVSGLNYNNEAAMAVTSA